MDNWIVLLKKNLAIAIPIIISSLAVMGCSIGSAQMVSFKSEMNWYFLGLFLPINYIMLGLLESGRLCSIRNASSSFNERLALKKTYIIIGIHTFFIATVITFLLIIFFMKWNVFYIPSQYYAEFLKFSIAYSISYIFISSNSIFNAALFGLGKNIVALWIIVGISLFFFLMTYAFYHYTSLGLYSLVISTTLAYAVGTIIAWFCVKSFFINDEKLLKNNLINDNEKKRESNWFACKKLVLNSGLPIFFSYLIMPLSMLIFNKILSIFGEAVVAAFGIVCRFQAMCMLPALALGVATGILSNRLEDKNPSIQLQYKKMSLFFSFLISMPIILALIVFDHPLSLWLSNSISVQKNIVLYFHYTIWTYVSFFPLITLMTIWEQTGLALKGLFLNIFILLLQILSGVLALQYHDLALFYELSSVVLFFSAAGTLIFSFYYKRGSEKCITV